MTKRLKPDERKIRDYGGLSVSEHRLYGIWCGMIQRCENKNRNGYEKYGARGISVCDEWHDFPSFVEWARSSGYDDDLTIDRINVNGNYELPNCRWASNSTQANNKRSSKYLDVGGIRGTVKQWAVLIGVSEYTIYECVKVRGEEYASQRVADAIKTGDFSTTGEIKKTCVKCGKEIVVAPNRACTKYCPECKAIATKEKYQRYWQKKNSCGAKVVG